MEDGSDVSFDSIFPSAILLFLSSLFFFSLSFFSPIVLLYFIIIKKQYHTKVQIRVKQKIKYNFYIFQQKKKEYSIVHDSIKKFDFDFARMIRQIIGVLVLGLCITENKKNMMKGMKNWNAGGKNWGMNPWDGKEQYKLGQKKDNEKKDETQKKGKDRKNKTAPTSPQSFKSMQFYHANPWPAPTHNFSNTYWKPQSAKQQSSQIKQQNKQPKQNQHKQPSSISSNQNSSNKPITISSLHTSQKKPDLTTSTKNSPIISSTFINSLSHQVVKKDIINISPIILTNSNNPSTSPILLQEPIPTLSSPPSPSVLQLDGFSQTNPKRAHDNNVKGKYNSVMGTGNSVIGDHNIIRHGVKGPDS